MRFIERVQELPTLIRVRARIRFLIQLVGTALILMGAFNMFAVPLFDLTPVLLHRAFGIAIASPSGAYYIGDVLLISTGVVIVWLA